ncbi:MAG: hypothetical protein Q7S95_01710 [bacterium]|nr:hypothetical protein [bacterium]
MEGIMLVNAADLLEESAYAEPEHWSELFKHDHYDWNDPEWLTRDRRDPYAWEPVRLTKGYFAMVSVALYEAVMESSWRANVQLDPRGDISRVYAIRNGRRREGEPTIVYAHREIADVWSPGVFVDHMNGYSLDNRDVNLRRAGQNENDCNRHGTRTKNVGLPIGVARMPSGLYRGVVYRRIDGKRTSFRSAESWPTPEPAAAWYQAQLTTLHKRCEWVHNPDSVNYPVFPPLLESGISERSWTLRERARASERADVDIPF